MSVGEIPAPPLYNVGGKHQHEQMYQWAVQLVNYLQSVGVTNLSSANIGTTGTNVTALEYGDGYNHTTILTLDDVSVGAFTATTEGHGVSIYTFPTGVYMVTACHMDITSGSFGSATNSCEVGLGSSEATGAISTLTPLSMEAIVTGQTISDVSSFVVDKSVTRLAGAPPLFEATDSHDLYLNVAGVWNAASTATVTGTITFNWIFLGA